MASHLPDRLMRAGSGKTGDDSDSRRRDRVSRGKVGHHIQPRDTERRAGRAAQDRDPFVVQRADARGQPDDIGDDGDGRHARNAEVQTVPSFRGLRPHSSYAAGCAGDFSGQSTRKSQRVKGAAANMFQKKVMGRFLSSVPSQTAGSSAARGASGQELEEDGADQAHRRTHDRDRSGLTQQTAERRMIARGVTLRRRDFRADAVSPEVRDDKDDQPHAERLAQRGEKDGAAKIAQPAGCCAKPSADAVL